VEWSGSSTRLFNVVSLCDPIRLSATASRILELGKVASVGDVFVKVVFGGFTVAFA
jgi:hypothetical protein